jgi:hypothetical protein
MARTLWAGMAVAVLALAGGCVNTATIDAPTFLPPGGACTVIENPLLVNSGATFEAYCQVFNVVLSTLNDFGFKIAESNMYDGHIETAPRIAPGILAFLKPGNPDPYDRLLSTLQTYRHRCLVIVQPARDGGYFVALSVFKELEDLPRPTRSTAGAAVFRNENNVERQFEVIDPTVFEATWIPKGRDTDIEQMLLEQIKRRLP